MKQKTNMSKINIKAVETVFMSNLEDAISMGDFDNEIEREPLPAQEEEINGKESETTPENMKNGEY